MFKQQNLFSNHKIHVPFEQGLGCDVTVFRRNKMANIEEATCFLVNLYVVNVIFMKF